MAPFASSASAGKTTKTWPFAPPSLDRRIGSPTEIDVMVILPTTSSDLVSAAGGTASLFILTSFRSAGVICVFGGISRAATTMLEVGIGAGASDLAVWATKKVVAPAPTANNSPTISTSRARRRDRSSTITFLYGPFVCGGVGGDCSNGLQLHGTQTGVDARQWEELRAAIPYQNACSRMRRPCPTARRSKSHSIDRPRRRPSGLFCRGISRETSPPQQQGS